MNKNEINTGTYDGNMESNFIFNVKQSFTTASHYKINLDKNYSNIYSVRLVSSAIPNTAYTFNGNTIRSNIGEQTLNTRINNRLRWINKDEEYVFNNYIFASFIQGICRLIKD